MKLLTFAVLFLTSAHAHAHVGEAYGFGSRDASLAGATGAAGPKATSAYTNPAALGALGERKLLLEWSFLAMEPSFKSIDNVVLENNYVSDKTTPVRGSVDLNYKTTVGQAFNFAAQIAPSLGHLGLGITFFLPFSQLAYLDSGEAFVPEYFLYRARTQRSQFELGLGAEIANQFFVGAGLHLSIATTTHGKVFLQTSDQRASTLRMKASARPKLSPVFGLLWRQNTPSAENDSTPLSFGAVVRLPLSAINDTTLNSGTGIFTGYNALDVNFNATASQFYDPLTVELSAAIPYAERALLLAQVDWQRWSAFDPPALNIRSSSGIVISTSKNPSFTYRDIWVPRVGHELRMDGWNFRAGYSYRPSILTALPTGAGNYLDPGKHMLSAGVGLPFESFVGLAAPCELHFHSSLHLLESQTITKTAGNEQGDTTDLKVGAPGYTAGGKVYGGGVSLSFAF